MKMEPIVSSETSAIRTQTPGNYPKRNKLHLEHGESLRTTNIVLYFVWSREDVVDIPTRQRTGGFRVRIPVRETDIFLLESAQTGSGAYPASYSLDIGVLALGYSGRSLMLISHLFLVPRLRMDGSKPPLPIYDYLLKNLNPYPANVENMASS